jgi:tetratricopeptide (TPR) repeat protein
MSTLVVTARPRLCTFAVAATLLSTLAAGGLGPVTALGAEPQQVSQAVVDKYNPAAEAFKKRDFPAAVKLAKECLGVAKSAYEKQICLNIEWGAAGSSGAFAEAIDTGETLLSLEGVPAALKLNVQKGLATIYPRVNKLDKAIAVTKEYMKVTGGAPADWALLANFYSAQKDCANGMPALEKALAGGKQADEPQLKSESFCADKSKNVDKRITVNEELLKRFPKKDAYLQLLNIYETGDKKLEDPPMLALLRFGFERDFLDDEAEFVRMANLCLDVGMAAEAQRVLEKVFQKKLVKTGDKPTDKVPRLLDQAKVSTAADKKSIEQADAEARAGKNGESDVKLGFRYYAMQQYDKAVEALQRGQQPDRAARIKRPDDANMMLGTALVKLKKNADAAKAFNEAKVVPRMAPVARIWLNAT